MSENLIYKRIPEVMKDIGSVEKSRMNEQQKYKFRGIEDFYQAAHPAFAKHGVFCAPEVLEREQTTFERTNEYGKSTTWRHVTLKVRHRFYAEDGSFVDVITVGEGLDNSDKASNKAMSGAMKYALIELFSVPTQDIEDADKTTPTVERNTEEIQVSSPRPQRAPDSSAVKGKADPVKAATPAGVLGDPSQPNALLDALEKSLAKREPGDDSADECIDRGQQVNLYRAFKDAVPAAMKLKDGQKDTILQEWLKHEGYIREGKGSTQVIPAVLFEEVKANAVKYAQGLK